MKLILAAAAILGIFGVALLTAPAQALTPIPAVLPAQCPGVIGSYNVINRTDLGTAVVYGTSGNDFILLRNGQAYGGDGNDCILFIGGPSATTTTGIAEGGYGSDVIIRPSTGTPSGIADGDWPGYLILSETYLPPGCDPNEEDENASDYCTDYSAVYAVDSGIDRCIGRWAMKVDCELVN